MTPDIALLAQTIGLVGTIVGGVAAMAVVAYRIGKVHSQLEHLVATTERVASATKANTERLEAVGVLSAKVEQLEESHAEERRRFVSKFPQVDQRLAALEERTAGILRQSQGRFGE